MVAATVLVLSLTQPSGKGVVTVVVDIVAVGLVHGVTTVRLSLLPYY